MAVLALSGRDRGFPVCTLVWLIQPGVWGLPQRSFPSTKKPFIGNRCGKEEWRENPWDQRLSTAAWKSLQSQPQGYLVTSSQLLWTVVALSVSLSKKALLCCYRQLLCPWKTERAAPLLVHSSCLAHRICCGTQICLFATQKPIPGWQVGGKTIRFIAGPALWEDGGAQLSWKKMSILGNLGTQKGSYREGRELWWDDFRQEGYLLSRGSSSSGARVFSLGQKIAIDLDLLRLVPVSV